MRVKERRAYIPNPPRCRFLRILRFPYHLRGLANAFWSTTEDTLIAPAWIQRAAPVARNPYDA